MGAPSPTPAPERVHIAGLILAGGRALRMGGVDKGLQAWQGRALVDHAISRLQPQVATLLISANRHADDYAARGWPVLRDHAATDAATAGADTSPPYHGPLAGLLAGLRAARTPWLAVVPCDAPRLPADLVERLAAGAADHAGAAAWHRAAHDAAPRIEPLCCLLRSALADDLAAWMAEGHRKVEAWLARHDVAAVHFDRPQDAGAFANFNCADDLRG